MSTREDSGTTGELRQVDEAARWLDDADRVVLALWREEIRGLVTRGELADRLETSRGDADIRIQRMRTSLESCRVLVAALSASPQCRGLAVPVSAWDGAPGPQWRKRFGRHIQECRTCRGRLRGEESVERLVAAAVSEDADVPAESENADVPAYPVTATPPISPAALIPTPVTITSSPAVAAREGTREGAREGAPEGTREGAREGAREGTRKGAREGTREGQSREKAGRGGRGRRRGKGLLVAGLVTVALVGAGAFAYPSLVKRPGQAAEVADVAEISPAPSASPESAALTVTDAPGVYTFAAAKAYCADLDGDWALPSRIELLSAITPARFFWTSTTFAASRKAWVVNGSISRGADQTARHSVRCTRSVTSTAENSRITAGQVIDPHTGLTWQRAYSRTAMAASAASGYCADLTLGGRSWRLPTVRELATTVDDSRVLPAVDSKIFPGTPKSGWFWAAPEAGRRWALTYRDGSTDTARASIGYVRCVVNSTDQAGVRRPS